MRLPWLVTPFLDRCWPLRIIAGTLFTALTLLAMFGEYAQANSVPYPGAPTDPTGYRLLVLALALQALLAIVIGWRIAYPALAARQRTRLRLAALAGDLSAMPLVTIGPRTSAPPDQARPSVDATITIRWQLSGGVRWVLIPFAALVVGAPVALLLLALIGNTLVWSGSASTLLGSDVALGAIVGAPILLGLLIALVSMARPVGVVADADGLTQRGWLGRGRRIPWAMARLLEVAPDDGWVGKWPATYVYRLYTADGAGVVWRCPGMSQPGSNRLWAPYRLTEPQMRERSLALLTLIQARAGLAPRSCELRLTRAPTVADAPMTPQRIPAATNAKLALVGLLGLALIASVALVFPPTTSALVNGLLLIPVGVVAIMLLAPIVRLLSRWRQCDDGRRDAAQNPLALGPSSVAFQMEQTYIVVYGWSPRQRAICALSGLMLLPELLPAALFLLAQAAPGAALLRVSALASGVAATISAGALATLGIIGAALLVFGATNGMTVITADAQGMTAHIRPRPVTIPWRAVGRLTAKRVILNGEDTGVTSYTLLAEGDAPSIVWPAGGVNPLLPQRGAQSLTPQGLAALVVARSGVALVEEPTAVNSPS